MPNYYQTLGLQHQASVTDLRQAYLRLAKELHPDLHPDDPSYERRFKDLQEAYRVLSKPELREAYDEFLHGFEDEGHHENAADHLVEFGASLYQELEVSVGLCEAILGCAKTLRLPRKDEDGNEDLQEFILVIPPGSEHGQFLSLAETGAEEALGLRFKLKIQIPQNLSRRQKKLLAEFMSLEEPSNYPRRQAFQMRSAHA
jgi:DnaJ-class molecular chaperone